MQTATCWVTFHKNGSNIQKHGVTPAEVVVLRTLHQNEVGREPITDLTEVKDDPRTDGDEIARLRTVYGGTFVDGGKTNVLTKLFPGDSPTLPKTFKDVKLEVSKTHEPAKVPEPVKAPAAKQ